MRMEGNARPRFTPKQKAELWDRWRNGQCIADIARALERNGAGAAGCMAEREGFEPPVPRRAQQISSLPRSTTPASLRGPNEARILSGARDPLLPVHVLAQGARHANRPVGVLAVLENRDQGAPDGEAGAVQGMHRLGLALLVAESRLHAARLERLEVGARGDLAIRLLRRQPDLDIVGLRRRKAGVPGAQRHHAVRKL